MRLFSLRDVRNIPAVVLRHISSRARDSRYSAEEVRQFIRLDPSTDPRAAAVHAAAAQVGAWSALLPRGAARDLGGAAERLPSVLYWYCQGLSTEQIGRRLAPFGGAWDGERAVDAVAGLVAALLNRTGQPAPRRGDRLMRLAHMPGGSRMEPPYAKSPPPWTVRLRDGREVRLRPIRPDDATGLVALFKRLSQETVRLRFFTAAKRADPREAARFASVDHANREAFVAATGPSPETEEVIVGVGRFDRTGPDRAELALLVEDAYQGLGLGRALLGQLLREASRRGLRTLHGNVLPENRRMLRLLQTSGYPVALAEADGTVCLTLTLRGGHTCPAA